MKRVLTRGDGRAAGCAKADNKIGSHGACDLAYSLKDNKSLQELYLKGANFADLLPPSVQPLTLVTYEITRR